MFGVIFRDIWEVCWVFLYKETTCDQPILKKPYTCTKPHEQLLRFKVSFGEL